MTYNDLLAGMPGATYNLLKSYEGIPPEKIGYLLIEVRWGEFYTCFMFDKSFSYCLFASKFNSEKILADREMMKANNPEFYAFAESVKHLFGH